MNTQPEITTTTPRREWPMKCVFGDAPRKVRIPFSTDYISCICGAQDKDDCTLENIQMIILTHACEIVRDAFSPNAGGLGEAAPTPAQRRDLANAGVACLLEHAGKITSVGSTPASDQE